MPRTRCGCFFARGQWVDGKREEEREEYFFFFADFFFACFFFLAPSTGINQTDDQPAKNTFTTIWRRCRTDALPRFGHPTMKNKQTPKPLTNTAASLILATGLAVLALHWPRFLAPPTTTTTTTTPALKSICLNMIARDEAANIEATIHALAPHVSSYTVCDTGSTDATPALVTRTFRKHGISGRVAHHTWRNFAHNRNLCLTEAAAHQADSCNYWLLVDADQILETSGLASLQSLNLTQDSYLVQHRSQGLVYANVRLVSSKRTWKYVGATHEYIAPANDGHHARSNLPVDGVYVHQTSAANGGNRANKFTRDLGLLLDEAKLEPDNARTQFYLANTYKALGDPDAAIQHYMRRIQLGGWIEEVYMSGYETGLLLERMHDAGDTLTSNTTHALRDWVNRTITQPTLDDVRAVFSATAQSLPYRVEAHYNVARLFRAESKNGPCFAHAVSASLKGPHHAMTLFSQRYAVDYGVDNELCICGYYVQDAVSRALGRRACESLVERLEARGEYESLLNQTRKNLDWYGRLQAIEVRGVA